MAILKVDLGEVDSKLYGQPFITADLIPEVKRHFKIDSARDIKPKKPLVLRFHGPIGVGKTKVAHRFWNMKFFRRKHFFPSKMKSELNEPQAVSAYQDELRRTIESSVASCKRSLFIFDDVQELPVGFFDDLPPFKMKPTLNYQESLFIFISQEDSEEIVSATSQLLAAGRPRESLDISTFLKTMKNLQGNFLTSLWDSAVSTWGSMSHEVKADVGYHELYVPFLPLARVHVIMCIQEVLSAAALRTSLQGIREVLSRSGCAPGEELCPLGCKLVHSKVFTISTFSPSSPHHSEL